MSALPGRRQRDLAGAQLPRGPDGRRRRGVRPALVSDALKYVIAAAATATLIAAAGSAMLGLSRLSYALATNRQIPSALGRLHPRRGTPYVVITLAARHRGRCSSLRTTSSSSSASTPSARCSASRSPTCRSSCCATASRTRKRPYRMPFSVRVGGGDLPIPAVARRGPRRRWRGSACSSPTAARATSASAGWRPASCSTSSTA